MKTERKWKMEVKKTHMTKRKTKLNYIKEGIKR